MQKNKIQTLPIILIILVIVLIISGFFVFKNYNKKERNQVNDAHISYIPFGDSVTIGLGVPESHRLPNVMVEHFAKEGINIGILENPAVSGYTVDDVIQFELPVLETLKPDFVTVFIGTNDSFSRTDVKLFESDYKKLLDKLQKLLVNPKKIVLITIPDYSQFPGLKQYKNNNLPHLISSYNEIIKQESIKRDLFLADIYPVSQTMTEEKDFISDGIHPSKAGYMKWEKVIYPKVKKLLLN